ncbi:MFS general substrate transporter [Fomitiporia mediterranea MF3/22]|uniref:MFS general substrate transporter n=1 Tax=Fomitiporia mediterranea (strain MF3/22) TaxID=694068 RepID=UPI0004408B1A|nr:MFS general substrate transporter [Fomitiporia mediterranea MF3/22]EJC99613.1 MFS general substrate transporter [Fomitiporia mediterranea MF3/22]
MFIFNICVFWYQQHERSYYKAKTKMVTELRQPRTTLSLMEMEMFSLILLRVIPSGVIRLTNISPGLKAPVNKSYLCEKMVQTPDIVTFSKNDPDDSKNCICCAAAELQIIARYSVNADTASSGLTVYVLGFSLGPLFCPLSEMYGRTLPYRLSWPMLVVTCAMSAWIDNIVVIIVLVVVLCLICTTLLTCKVKQELTFKAIALYAAAISAGPCIALPIGFFVSANAPSELWVLRVYFFFVLSLLPVVWLLPETHGPTVLAWRSKKLRKEGMLNACAAHELKHESKKQVFITNIGRPAAMFLREPIVQGAAIWTSLAYGIVYFFFEAYPVVFFEHHNFPLQLTGLPFLAMVVGFQLAALPYRYLVRIFSNIRVPSFIQPGNQSPDSPESALKLAVFGWSSGSETHWIVPTLAGTLYAFSTLIIFYTFLTYASACNTFWRSLIGSIFPVASHSIISRLGTKWGVSLFGFLSLGLLPIPIIFLRYGEIFRKNSHYGHEANTIVAKMRAVAAQAKRDTQLATSNASVSSQRKSTDAIIELTEHRITQRSNQVNDVDKAGKKWYANRNMWSGRSITSAHQIGHLLIEFLGLKELEPSSLAVIGKVEQLIIYSHRALSC